MSLWTLLLVVHIAGWACGAFCVAVLIFWLVERQHTQQQDRQTVDSPYAMHGGAD